MSDGEGSEWPSWPKIAAVAVVASGAGALAWLAWRRHRGSARVIGTRVLPKTGDVYTGELMNGKANGFGTALFTTGFEATGHWEDDVMVGPFTGKGPNCTLHGEATSGIGFRREAVDNNVYVRFWSAVG